MRVASSRLANSFLVRSSYSDPNSKLSLHCKKIELPEKIWQLDQALYWRALMGIGVGRCGAAAVLPRSRIRRHGRMVVAVPMHCRVHGSPTIGAILIGLRASVVASGLHRVGRAGGRTRVVAAALALWRPRRSGAGSVGLRRRCRRQSDQGGRSEECDFRFHGLLRVSSPRQRVGQAPVALTFLTVKSHETPPIKASSTQPLPDNSI